MVHIHDGILLSHKKKEAAICSNMDGPRDCYAGWNKSDREGEIPYDIPYMGNLKRNYTNELIYGKEIDSQTQRTYLWLLGEEWWEQIESLGIHMYTLPYLKWVTRKVLLYTTGTSAQCYVAAWMGGEFGEEWILGCIWLSPFAVHLKSSQYC